MTERKHNRAHQHYMDRMEKMVRAFLSDSQFKQGGETLLKYAEEMIRDIDKETMKALGLKNRHGALIPQVEAGSAADKAGVQAGDVIVQIDEHEIKQAHDLPIQVAGHKPGDKVQVKIIRDGKRITILAEG